MDSTDFSLLTVALVIAYIFSLMYSGVINNPDLEELLRYGLLCVSIGLAVATVARAFLDWRQT